MYVAPRKGKGTRAKHKLKKQGSRRDIPLRFQKYESLPLLKDAAANEIMMERSVNVFQNNYINI